MKKKLFIIIGIICSLVFIPDRVSASSVVTNFKETINEEISIFKDVEGFEEYIDVLENADLSNYKESNDKINIYIFRGDSCGFCLKAVSYFASILPEYGKYFNLITYEVWGNTDNASLMQEVASTFNETVDGVPYIVIGDKTFNGYSEQMNSEIEAQIKKMYNEKKPYDVMKNLGKKIDANENSSNILLWIFQIVSLIGIGVIIYINIKNKNTLQEMNEKIERLENEIKKRNKTKK